MTDLTLQEVAEIVIKDLDLRGMDYFSQKQAAKYMNRSLAKFKQTVKTLHIPFFWVDGIKTFRKTDVQGTMEAERQRQWQQSGNGGRRTAFIGTIRRENT